MSFSWFQHALSWFKKEPLEKRGISLDQEGFQHLCEQDPDAAQELLRADQKDLVGEFERTYAAYRSHLEQFSSRLADCFSPERRQELALLREAQDTLRRALRRLETSGKTARQLERELAEWQMLAQAQKDTPEKENLYADHPHVRLEMTRSELAIRQEMVGKIKKEDEELAKGGVWTGLIEEEQDREGGKKEELEDEEVSSVDSEHLLAALQRSIQEAERWHLIQQPDEEALYQVHDVRQLHARLKQQDRLRGIHRDRLSLAIRMHE